MTQISKFLQSLIAPFANLADVQERRRPAASTLMLTAQTTADAFALLCSCGLLALSGGVASLLAPLALLLGAAGTFPVQMLLVAMAAATIARMCTWSREATARDEDTITRIARVFLFYPECIVRWAILGTQAVAVHEAPNELLLVGALPIGARIRGFARAHLRERDITIINLCREWQGYATQYEELGLRQVVQPAGVSYVVDAIDEVKRW